MEDIRPDSERSGEAPRLPLWGRILLLLVGLYMSSNFLQVQLRSWDSQGWERVEAAVVSSELVPATRAYKNRSEQGWELIVVFEYQVDGETFRSHDYGLEGGGGWFTDQNWARRKLEELGPGDSAELWVNPDDPEDAVHVREYTDTGSVWGQAVGLGIVVYALFG